MGQEESRVYAGVGYTKKEAAQNLENLLRFYVNGKYRVVWYREAPGVPLTRLCVQRDDKSLVAVTCKQDEDTGLHSCEATL